jgi:hypothetical protein
MFSNNFLFTAPTGSLATPSPQTLHCVSTIQLTLPIIFVYIVTQVILTLKMGAVCSSETPTMSEHIDNNLDNQGSEILKSYKTAEELCSASFDI